MIDPGIIEAVIAALAVVISSLIGYGKFRQQVLKLKQAQNEIDVQKKALSFTSFITEWDQTYKELEYLLENTEIDRFMILRAWNGSLSPKWTTAIFQIRTGNQLPVSYVHYELDHDYVGRLKEVIAEKQHEIVVDEINASGIKEVYESEGVLSSCWYLLGTEKLDKDSSAITYCTFSSLSKKKITKATKTRCKVIADRMSGVLEHFEL